MRKVSSVVNLLGMFLFVLFSTSAIAAENASDFNLPTKDRTIQLSGLRGRVVYLDFWASWCPPCRKSFPWMEEMYQRYEKQGLTVVAVNLDKDKALADKFLETMPAKFTVAFDPQGKVAEQYRLQGMPTSYLIDRQGRIHSSHIGFRESDTGKLESVIKK